MVPHAEMEWEQDMAGEVDPEQDTEVDPEQDRCGSRTE